MINEGSNKDKLNENHIVPRRLGEASSTSGRLSVLTQDH